MEQDVIERKALDIQELNILISDLKKTNDMITQVQESARGAAEGRTISMWFGMQSFEIVNRKSVLDDYIEAMNRPLFRSWGSDQFMPAKDTGNSDQVKLELSNGNALRILAFVMEGLESDRQSILKKIHVLSKSLASE